MRLSPPMLLALACLSHLGAISTVHAFQHGRVALFKRCDTDAYNLPRFVFLHFDFDVFHICHAFHMGCDCSTL